MRNGMTVEQGAKIVIEDNTKPPSIVSEGIPVRSGTSANIGITLERIKRLEDPFESNCTSEWPSDKYGKAVYMPK